MTAVLGDRTDTFFDSFRRLAATRPKVARISSVLGSVDQSLIDRTGGRASPYEGAYVTGWYPVASDARWDEMQQGRSAKHAFGDNRIDPADAGVQTTWIAYTVLKQVVESIGEPRDHRGHAHGRPGQGRSRWTPAGSRRRCSWRYEDMLAARRLPADRERGR